MYSLSCWPIRRKLIGGGIALCLIVTILAASGFRGVYAYRNLVRSLRGRASELPIAAELAQHVSELRITASRMGRLREFALNATSNLETQLRRDEFRNQLMQFRTSLQQYRNQLTKDGDGEGETPIDDNKNEWGTVGKLEASLKRIAAVEADPDWMLDQLRLNYLNEELDDLYLLAKELPSHLHGRLHNLASEVRSEYSNLIYLTWITSVFTVILLALLGWFFSFSIFQPLRRLLHDARIIEAGNFDHRICITTKDEIAELASAMNAMTDRFQEINVRLEEKVEERTCELKERTRELIQSEQLASVGYLAAGVAHEINNPLQAIAGYSDALEMRLAELPQDMACSGASEFDFAFLQRSLNRIHDAAIRCKGITDKLLDFSRMGKAERSDTDLRALTLDVIEMIHAVGKYKGKKIEFIADEAVVASVNEQEMKQVVLNLLANALESLGSDGVVQVQLRRAATTAELIITDNGCGMAPDVLQHLFKPFFTNRREGAGEGTGLGLSITHRIIQDHHGAIQAFSEGPGKGSRMRVTLPLKEHEEQHESRHKQAA